jgi:hypothetical protein
VSGAYTNQCGEDEAIRGRRRPLLIGHWLSAQLSLAHACPLLLNTIPNPSLLPQSTLVSSTFLLSSVKGHRKGSTCHLADPKGPSQDLGSNTGRLRRHPPLTHSSQGHHQTHTAHNNDPYSLFPSTVYQIFHLNLKQYPTLHPLLSSLLAPPQPLPGRQVWGTLFRPASPQMPGDQLVVRALG